MSREVVRPADAMVGEPVEDRAVRRRVLEGVEDFAGCCGGAAERGAGEQKAAVRVGRPGHRAEPVVGERERVRQRVGERQHLGRVVAHRLGCALLGADEAVHRAAIDLLVRRLPALRDVFRLRSVREREATSLARRCRPRVEFVAWPSASNVKPSTSAACEWSSPSRLSKEWFSIITTTMWSNGISSLTVPDGLVGERQAAGLPREWSSRRSHHAITMRANIPEILILPPNSRLETGTSNWGRAAPIGERASRRPL